MSPPPPPQAVVHDVDIEPEAATYARSFDPGIHSTDDADESTNDVLNTDHNSRPVHVDNDADPDQQMSSLYSSRDTATTSFSMLTASGSQRAITGMLQRYLAATVSANLIRRQIDRSFDT